MKKSTRDDFRNAVFKRDKYLCAMCGHKPESIDQLDAHHITDRTYMPFGGYCAANGISLCTDRCVSEDCHRKAESLHASGFEVSGYAPTDLYARIKSSYKWAYLQSLRLELEADKVDAMSQIIDKISNKELEICVCLSENISQETWELTCDELGIHETLIRTYGKGRYIGPNLALCTAIEKK
jgi:hypothetical protein